MTTPSELRDRAAKMEEQAAALRADADQMELTELAKDPTAFFQAGRTYQNRNLRLNAHTFWTFRCKQVTRRRDGEVIANGAIYWSGSDGKVARGDRPWTETHTMKNWNGRWTDITEATE